MKKNLDSYFKNKLSRPQSPPPDAWSKIASHLPQKSKRRIFPMIWKSAAVIALLIGLWGTGYWFGHNNAKTEVGDRVTGTTAAGENSPVSTVSQTGPSVTAHTSQNPSESDVQNLVGSETLTVTEEDSFAHHTPSQQRFSESANGMSSGEDSPNTSPSAAPLQFYGPGWGISEPEKNPVAYPKFEMDPSLSSMENAWPDAKFALHNPETNPFEKKTNKKNKKNQKNMDFDRFHVAGFMSPMSLNSFVGSSMLSDEMSSFKTENSIILAYGLKGGYSLSPTVKLRTGLSVVGFEQITKNVPIASSAKNMSAHLNSVENVHYKGPLRIGDSAKDPAAGMEGNTSTGDIRQQSQYYEIPLEAEVRLVETGSIGISATGGASTWLLSKNKIYVHTDGFTEELGRANNLNTTSFSANLGLKFDMKLTEDVQLNLEPGFKYLINPVNNIEKFNPYTIGVNAGVSVSLK